MATDMLRLAGETERVRTETFVSGEIDAPRRAPPACAASAASGDLRAPVMHALVMGAVVPRLAEKLRAKAPSAAPRRGGAIEVLRARRGDAAVDGLVDSLLRNDLAGTCRAVEAACAAGRSLERVYLDLLAPAAAAVDRLVEGDGCPAAAGTLAFCNLQLVLRRYAAAFYEEGRSRPRGSRALLVPARPAGGASTFGLMLAADFLRRAGWEAWIETSLRSATLAETVAGHRFDLVEILAADIHPDTDDATAVGALRDVAAAIRAIRRDGANPDVVIVACGPAFARDPGLAGRLGADRAGSDPLSALRLRDPCASPVPSTQAPSRHLS